MSHGRATRRMGRLAVSALAVWAVAVGARAEDDAKAFLKAMADYLSAQQTISLSFDSDIEVITPELEKIQFASSGEALLGRPDKLRAHRRGGHSDVELVYDGETASILDRDGNAFIRFEAPGTVDHLIAALRDGHGVSMPGADLLLTDAYQVLVAGVIEAKHVGQGIVDGRECEHLAFRNLETDWQLWVRSGDQPLPCKMVITSKAVGGAPQYTLRVKDWRTDVEVAADAFDFVAPPGAGTLAPDDLIHLDELPLPANHGENE